ncbi:MAG: hypothetical protein HYY25_15760 [Candidatus Wallbacteria bacterium]|nr:hypothetical protein [Candidatus Wallbacteria bacterium]
MTQRGVRKGNVLLLVLLVLAIAGAAAFLANSWLRRRNLSAHRFQHGEVALNLAQGAMAEAEQRLLAREMLGSGEPAGSQLLTRPASRVDWTDVIACPISEGLAGELPGGGVVTVTARLSEFEPLLPAGGLHGVQQDAMEKRGKLMLLSEATYGLATRRVIVERDVMVVGLVPPVVTRFSLVCLGEPALPEARLNSLEYDAVRRSFSLGSPPREASPLVVRAPPEGSLAGVAAGGGLASLAPEPSRLKGLFRQAGWVYLGGAKPWVLNLTLGPGVGNPLEEGHLLRRTEHVVASSAVAGCQEKVHLFGFAAGGLDSAMFAGRGLELPGTEGAVPSGTSALRLSGDLARAAPTVVLGRVYRRYLSFSKVRKGSEGPFESCVFAQDAGDFDRVGGRFRTLTGAGYEAYSRMMPRAVVEPYNRSYDFLVTNRESSDTARPYLIEPGETPAFPASQLTLALIGDYLRPEGIGRAFFLYPGPGAGPSPVQLQRPGAQGDTEVVFKGDLGRLAGYGDVLRARRVCRSKGPAQRALARFLTQSGGRAELAIPAVAHLGAGDLELPALRVRRGGTLVVDGSITVAGAIEASAGEQLVLASLGGDIRLATTDRVQAALLAPKGRLVLAAGGAEIAGTVLVASLDNLPEACAGPGPRSITWDAALDPLDPVTVARSYRVFASARTATRIER